MRCIETFMTSQTSDEDLDFAIDQLEEAWEVC